MSGSTSVTAFLWSALCLGSIGCDPAEPDKPGATRPVESGIDAQPAEPPGTTGRQIPDEPPRPEESPEVMVLSGKFVGPVAPPRPKKSPEVQVLDKFVGEWAPPPDIVATLKVKWALDEAYLEIDTHLPNEAELYEMSLIAWDKEKKAYRLWTFGRWDFGSPQEGEGTWDGTSNTLTFTCVPRTNRPDVIIFTVNDGSLSVKDGLRDESGDVNWFPPLEWRKQKAAPE